MAVTTRGAKNNTTRFGRTNAIHPDDKNSPKRISRVLKEARVYIYVDGVTYLMSYMRLDLRNHPKIPGVDKGWAGVDVRLSYLG